MVMGVKCVERYSPYSVIARFMRAIQFFTRKKWMARILRKKAKDRAMTDFEIWAIRMS